MNDARVCDNCGRSVGDRRHSECKICRGATHGGHDDDGGHGPGVAPIQPESSPGIETSLAPTAEPNHRVSPSTVTA